MSAPSRSTQISGEENTSEPFEYPIKDASSNSEGAKPKSKDSSNGIVDITNIEENGYNEPITTNEVVPQQNSSTGITSVSSTVDLYAIQRDSNQLPFTNDTETNSETKNKVKTSLIHSNSLVSKHELDCTNNGDIVNIIKIQTVQGHQDKFLDSEKAVSSLSHQENLEMQEYQTRGPDVANTSAQNRDLNGTGSDHVAESSISSDNMGTGYESKHLSEDMYLQTQANNSEREDYNDTGQVSDTAISSNVEKSEEKKLKKPKKSSAKTEKLSTAEKLDKSQQEHIVRKAANVREAVKAHREGKRRGQESSDEEEEEEKTLETSPDGKYYKVNQEIGRGSFKTVYRGLDANTGVAVAWCELMENNVKKEERQRFREEAAMLKGLQHPNIVRFYDFWEVKKQDDSKKTAQSNVQDHSMRLKGRRSIVIITELMTSGTLKKYIGRFRAIPERLNARVLKSWCRQILKGLYFLHTRTPPIIHRDLKCDNIFITGGTGSIKIGDLGLATLKTQSVAKSVIGTPEFMAPEMYDEEYDEAVDVYAFGMCMLEMTTNEYPYRECTGPAQIFRRVTGGVKPKSFAKVDSPDFRALIDWCTKSEKDDRPTIKQLIGHPFFEDPGFTLELVNRDAVIEMRESMATFRLRFTDQRKQGQNREAIGKHKEGEAIEFNFNLESDNTVEVTSSMLQSGILKNEEDRKTVANAMETQVSALLKDRNEVPDENDEEQDANNEQNPSSPEPPPSPPPSPVPTNHPVLQNNNQSIDPMALQYQTLHQSKDMDAIKSHGTERLAVSNTVTETLAIENPQHSNDGTTDSGYQTQPGIATNSNVQFQSKPSIASSSNEQCLVESSSHSVSQQLADQYQLYQQLPDGHVQVYKLPAGIVPILVPTSADHLKHEQSNTHQMQLQGNSQITNTISNKSSCIPTRTCTLVNKVSSSCKNEYGDAIKSANTPIVSNYNEDNTGKEPSMIHEDINLSANNNQHNVDHKGLYLPQSIQPSNKTADVIHSNSLVTSQPGEQGLNMEGVQQTSASETTGSRLHHSYKASHSNTQYISTAYIPDKTHQIATTLSQQVIQNMANPSSNYSLHADKNVVHSDQTNEVQFLASIGAANQNIENMSSDQGSPFAPCNESHNQLQKPDTLHHTINQGHNNICASQFISTNMPEQLNTLQQNLDEPDSQLPHTSLRKDNNIPSHIPLTQMDINAPQTVIENEKHTVEQNILRKCVIPSETTQKLSSNSENSSHQQLCETCGSISVVGENTVQTPSTDFNDDDATVRPPVCSVIDPLKCNSPHLSREISKPALIAPQNTPVHPIKSYTTQTKVIEVDGVVSGQINVTSTRSFSGTIGQIDGKEDLIAEANIQGIGGYTATKGNLLAAVRPSIPNFEIQQGTESTAYTDSDADYESGKPQQRKSKPEKKKKRTTNLGPRVRVMNSTAITDSGGDVSEVKLECHLEVKSEDSCGKTLTFEFSYPDVDPDEISHEFVKTNYIKEQHREIVLHQINDIIRQLNDNVTKTPVVAFPPDIQQPLNLPPSSAIKTDTLQKNNMDEIEKPQDVENDSTIKPTHTTTNRNEAGRFSISSVTETGPSSSTASPTRSRFSVERIEAPVNSIAPKDNNQLAENATGRFAVTQMSDSSFETQSSPFSTQQAENIEMTGSVSSTVSSGGNNTPFVEGTPTSTIHSQHGIHNERQYSDHKGYSDQVEQELQKHTNQGETHHVLPESKTTDKEKDGSGVTLDMEFTQKLQDIMGKGSQSPAVNTPTSIINKNETDVETLSQQAIPHSSGGNSRFSVSPVSENKNMNTSVGGTTEEILIDEHGRGISTVRESSPSPAGSNYTTASESERQNVNEAVNTIYEDKIGSTQLQASQEIMVNQSNTNDRKLLIDQHTNQINPNQEPLSSTSSASTIVAGNELNTIPISPNQSEIKSTTTATAVSNNTSEDAVSHKQDIMSAMIRDPGSSKVNVSEDNPVQISEAIRSLDERHRTEVVEHNKRLDDLRKLYLKERQELSSMLVSAIQRQEVRSDTISATDIQQTQPVSSTSSSMATAAMQMQQQQHHQMTGTGGVQIVPFVNTDGSIQPINLVPQQLSVSSMQQFQMLQQNQHSFMNQQQYSGGLHMQGSKTQNQVNLQQVASSSQGISTPPVVTQQSSFPNAQSQPLRSISQPQTQQINTQGQQASQQQTPVQPQTIRPVQQYQGQQSQPLTSTAQLPQPTATMPQEQQKLYQNSASSSQVAAQNTPNCTPAAQTPVPQSGGHNVSSQPQGLSSNNRQHQSVSNSSHVQGARVDQGSNGHASQVNTAPQQTVPPTYYFAPQPTYSVIPGVGETSNNVQPAHWPQIPTMAYIPHQSSNQLIHTTQPSLNSVPTSSADAANTMSNDNRPPSLAGHAFHHYQNGSSHTQIPHQLVLVPQPQNYAYLPHSGGHLPYNTYHQQPGLHGVPTAAGFAPLQPAVGHGSTSSPTPSAASQTSQQSVSQDSSAPAFNKSVHQVHQSTVKMVAESTGADVTSAHAQVIQSNPANQTTSVTGQQTTIPMMPHVVSQMQSQYQANLQAIQPIQHMGIAQNSVIPAQQHQHVQIPIGNVIHASATSTGVDPNDRGLSTNGIESNILNQAQSQATANTQQMQQQLSGTPQSSQGQGSS